MAYLLSSFAGAGAQFFDDNGTPLSGGKLYTYFAGTTTPATMYTDSTGANAHTNPIILDSAGRTPSEIWVDGGLVYKFILKTSTDTLIGTYDNIPGIDDPTSFNNLIAVIGTNTLLGTSTPPINGYVAGATYSFVVPNTNTGAVTISIDGLGAKEITYAGSNVLVAGQLQANSIAVIEYDGTRFQLTQSSTGNSTATSLTVINNATIGGNLTVTGSTFSVGGNNISAVNSLGFRNRIINGDMRIDQRNAGASYAITNVGGQYSVDRWGVFASQLSKLTVQQSTTAPTGFVNSLLFTSASAYSVTASDLFYTLQRIEGLNVADLGWGTANAQAVTLSFKVRSSLTGTFGGSIINSAGNRSYPFTFTINAANTFEDKTITIPGDTSGTWLTTNGVGIQVNFSLGMGSTYSGTAGAWAGAAYYSATGATSVVGTNGATFYITGVQLEAGSVATPFERRPYGTELALCQRYYISAPLQTGVFNALNAYTSCQFPVAMRATPTVTPVAGSGATVGTTSASTHGFNTVATAGSVPTGMSYTASIEL